MLSFLSKFCFGINVRALAVFSEALIFNVGKAMGQFCMFPVPMSHAVFSDMFTETGFMGSNIPIGMASLYPLSDPYISYDVGGDPIQLSNWVRSGSSS